MTKMDVQHDVIVIGAGLAGLVAANRAAQLGKRVVVLEKSREDKYICNSRYTYGTFHINFTDVGADEDVLFGKIEACREGFARKDLARAVGSLFQGGAGNLCHVHQAIGRIAEASRTAETGTE